MLTNLISGDNKTQIFNADINSLDISSVVDFECSIELYIRINVIRYKVIYVDRLKWLCETI